MATPMNNPCGTIDGISFEEPVGSGGYNITKTGGEGTRVFHIDWADRVVFSSALTGGINYNGSTVIYTAGKNFPGYQSLVCYEVAVKGFGTMSFTSAGDPSYPFAVVTASYKNVPVPQGGGGDNNQQDVIATEEMDAFYTDEQLKDFGMIFKTSGREITGPVPGAFRHPIIRHVLTEEISPTNKKAVIAASIGKVNSLPFLDVIKDKLLYEGAKSRRVITTDGSTTIQQPYRLVHTFLEVIDHTWQELWDDIGAGGAGAQFSTVQLAGDPPLDFAIYQQVDFNTNGLIG